MKLTPRWKKRSRYGELSRAGGGLGVWARSLIRGVKRDEGPNSSNASDAANPAEIVTMRAFREMMTAPGLPRAVRPRKGSRMRKPVSDLPGGKPRLPITKKKSGGKASIGAAMAIRAIRLAIPVSSPRARNACHAIPAPTRMLSQASHAGSAVRPPYALGHGSKRAVARKDANSEAGNAACRQRALAPSKALAREIARTSEIPYGSRIASDIPGR